ncbi:MAG: phage virion morphogenesis protein [Marinobacter sp.]|uniref:phage virion morphogenesis protein n=1 Tax=Marinobacter sp. TaxID=50741 RepID=UPI00299F3527|nr:phage virion morphogenesis protein [Marinobacter sp.]MDX1755878.1 phage virion morphogenesis protein [Marinobacter sp.]
MSTIHLEVTRDDVSDALQKLLHAAENPRDAMAGIAAVMESATERAFATESDPATGVAWDPLSEVTLAQRPHRAGGQILQDEGLLAGSIVSDFGLAYAEIGTNKVQAPTHQFGAEQGEFGRTQRGGPIPWGDIPARPFLGIGPDDEQDILDIVRQHLVGGFL